MEWRNTCVLLYGLMPLFLSASSKPELPSVQLSENFSLSEANDYWEVAQGVNKKRKMDCMKPLLPYNKNWVRRKSLERCLYSSQQNTNINKNITVWDPQEEGCKRITDRNGRLLQEAYHPRVMFQYDSRGALHADCLCDYVRVSPFLRDCCLDISKYIEDYNRLSPNTKAYVWHATVWKISSNCLKARLCNNAFDPEEAYIAFCKIKNPNGCEEKHIEEVAEMRAKHKKYTDFTLSGLDKKVDQIDREYRCNGDVEELEKQIHACQSILKQEFLCRDLYEEQRQVKDEISHKLSRLQDKANNNVWYKRLKDSCIRAGAITGAGIMAYVWNKQLVSISSTLWQRMPTFFSQVSTSVKPYLRRVCDWIEAWFSPMSSHVYEL